VNSADVWSPFDDDAFGRWVVAARRRASQVFHLQKALLDDEHRALEAMQSSPFLTDFEENYRERMAFGKITLTSAVEKIRSASWVPAEVIEHMVKHVALTPPSEEEIARYQELEREKELDRLRAQAWRQQAAMAEVARWLRGLERKKAPRRGRLTYLRAVQVRGKLHHYYDMRRRRSISVLAYMRRARISRAMLARKRMEG